MSYEAKRGIPLAREEASNSAVFTPLYSVEAVRFGRLFNRWLMIPLWVIYFGFAGFFVLAPLAATVAPGGLERSFAELFWALLAGFFIPCFTVLFGVICIPFFTARMAFDVRGAYGDTEADLRRWVSEFRGDLYSKIEDAKFEDAKSVGDIFERALKEDTFYSASEAVALGEKREITLSTELRLVPNREGYEARV